MSVVKWGLWIGGILAILVVIAVLGIYLFLKNSPTHVLNTLAKHPQKSSLYIAVDGEPRVTYEADVRRPLASVAKIPVAIEYAFQLEEGNLRQEERIPLEELNAFYIKNTDGGAHKEWLEEMENQDKIQDDTIPLQDVAAGMITYSSNANADYLVDRLGRHAIDERIKELVLDHDPIIPFTGSLAAVSDSRETNDRWETELREMSEEAYQQYTFDHLELLKQGKVNRQNVSKISLDAQRVWSDRMSSATAATYGQLLHQIAAEEFPAGVVGTIQELMEWPMEIEGNEEQFQRLGAKGGSTAFVMNQAMYMETHDGQQMELVLFMDDLTTLQALRMQIQMDFFILKAFLSESFLQDVEQELQA